VNRLRGIGVCLALLGVVGAWAQPNKVTPGPLAPTAGENITKIIGIDDKRKTVVPLSARFYDEDGKQIILRDVVKDKPTIIVPMFYKCTSTCPLIFNAVLECIRKFKDMRMDEHFRIVVIGIKPSETYLNARDKKEELMHVTGLAKMSGAKDGWRMLVAGSPKLTDSKLSDGQRNELIQDAEKEIRKVTDAIGYRYRYELGKDRVDHPAGIVILTPDGVVSRYFYGMEYVPKLVYNALKDADAKRVGPEAQVILFGCLEYDPLRGTYTPVIKNILMFFGVMTVLLVGGAVAIMGRKYNEGNVGRRVNENKRRLGVKV